jgi:hypothetical protein
MSERFPVQKPNDAPHGFRLTQICKGPVADGRPTQKQWGDNYPHTLPYIGGSMAATNMITSVDIEDFPLYSQLSIEIDDHIPMMYFAYFYYHAY